MRKPSIKEQQQSALVKINYCFHELKTTKPLEWENDFFDKNSTENSIKNLMKLSPNEQIARIKEMHSYLVGESTTDARLMLIVNYLYALLIDGKNNNISIHKNYFDKQSIIKEFEADNADLLSRLKSARDKVFAHIDLDWQTSTKNIEFKEFEVCIRFLNNLFNINYLYRFDSFSENQ